MKFSRFLSFFAPLSGSTSKVLRDLYFSPRRLRVLVGVMAMCEASRYTLSRLGGSKPMLGPFFGVGADRFDSRGHSVILSDSVTVLQCDICTTKTPVWVDSAEL